MADFVIAVCELLEAEGVLLRRKIHQLALSLALVALGALAAAAGLGFLLRALYLYLEIALGPPLAALLTGVSFIVLAGVLLWTAKRKIR